MGDWSRSPAPGSAPTCLLGAILSSVFKKADAWCSRRRSTALVYARHGTTFPTRLTVIDKIPADDPRCRPVSPGIAPDVATLLGWIADHVPPRPTVELPKPPSPTLPARSVRGYLARANAAPAIRKPTASPVAVEIAYEIIDAVPSDAARLSDAIYEEYGLQTIRIPGAVPHPTKLVQSAADGLRCAGRDRPIGPCCLLTSANGCRTPSWRR